MKPRFFALFVVTCVLTLGAQTASWQPSPGHRQLPIWPGMVPDAQPVPGPEMMKTDSDFLIAGRHVRGVYNVTRPTMTVYAPIRKNTGVAIVVFPVAASRDWRSTWRAQRSVTG